MLRGLEKKKDFFKVGNTASNGLFIEEEEEGPIVIKPSGEK